jgi:hypothetical protein
MQLGLPPNIHLHLTPTPFALDDTLDIPSAGVVQSASTAHRSAKTGSCARSQSPSKIESKSYCQSEKINEF